MHAAVHYNNGAFGVYKTRPILLVISHLTQHAVTDLTCFISGALSTGHGRITAAAAAAARFHFQPLAMFSLHYLAAAATGEREASTCGETEKVEGGSESKCFSFYLTCFSIQSCRHQKVKDNSVELEVSMVQRKLC